MTKDEKKQYDALYYIKNKEKKQRQSKEWIKNNPEKRIDMIRRYKYGTDGRKLFRSQNGICAICGLDLATKPPNQQHLDHCHKTGKVRGWLCVNCNLGIGRLHTVELLKKAILYMEK